MESRELIQRGFSRRQVGRIATLLGAGATLPFFNEAALAQRAASRNRDYGEGAVRIGSNENPLGPCPEALEAIYNVAKKGGRYGGAESNEFPKLAAEMEGLKQDYVAPYAGSSDPLFRATCAFVSPTRGLVMGDPGYESAASAASFIGAKVKRVPLTKDYKHDVKAMLAADPQAGVYYICNPNNPSGTLTPKEDIAWLVANKPAGSILLLDEAYIHFSKAESGTSMVAADKDVIVLRTFSKLYGMAGLRAGLAMARPDLLAKMRSWGSGMLPVTGMAGAAASLKVKNLIEDRRKINADVRAATMDFLASKNIKLVPSDSNKFMMDAQQPGNELVRKLAEQKVYIGRVWPIWPNHVRVTVGTAEEMLKFREALMKVWNS
jgi:histidinol-phosphate aminotransferase